jgi:hypothetical protein
MNSARFGLKDFKAAKRTRAGVEMIKKNQILNSNGSTYNTNLHIISKLKRQLNNEK